MAIGAAFLLEFLSMDCGGVDDADGGGGGGSETGRNVGCVTFGDSGPYE